MNDKSLTLLYTIRVLARAEDLLSKGWIQGAYSDGEGESPQAADAGCFCAFGALRRAAADEGHPFHADVAKYNLRQGTLGFDVSHQVMRIAQDTIRIRTGISTMRLGGMVNWNDNASTTKDEVLATFYKARVKAEQIYWSLPENNLTYIKHSNFLLRALKNLRKRAVKHPKVSTLLNSAREFELGGVARSFGICFNLTKVLHRLAHTHKRPGISDVPAYHFVGKASAGWAYRNNPEKPYSDFPIPEKPGSYHWEGDSYKLRLDLLDYLIRRLEYTIANKLWS